MGNIILTGDRPTGRLHLGHLVGSLSQRVQLQNSGMFDEMYIEIADSQATTDNSGNIQKVKDNVIEVALDYLSCGLDPNKCTIFLQSEVTELSDLTFYYMNLVTLSRLQRNPTIKQEIVYRNFENNNINEIIKNNEEISKLEERNPEYIVNKEEAEVRKAEKEKVVEEKMKVGQGNLVIGLSLNSRMKNEKFVASVYNAILGGGANSKLFQNVREKNSLAYTAGSTFRRQKNTIFLRCGIEIDNYNKALETIKEQIEDMKNGEFTTEDIENAKKLIIASVKGISSEQDTEITYYYGQELSDSFTTIEEYIDKISKVSKDDLLELAKEVWINTIYFLRD